MDFVSSGVSFFMVFGSSVVVDCLLRLSYSIFAILSITDLSLQLPSICANIVVSRQVALKGVTQRMKQFCRVDEVAGLLGVTEQTIRNWIREGKIKARRFGRPHLIPIEEAARLLDKTPEETAALLERQASGPLVLALT
jgi:excisionase family DNA binding protein